jgi:hypothetical protein
MGSKMTLRGGAVSKPKFPYSQRLMELIESVLPPDTPYIFVAAHYRDEEGTAADTNIISTEHDNAALARSLRAVARKLQGDS